MRRALGTAAILTALVALLLTLVGCGGGYSPTLPSPEGPPPGASSVPLVGWSGLPTGGLPTDLTKGAFQVFVDGVATEVSKIDYGASSGASVCFIIDTTGSMGNEIAGVRTSIQAFADSLAGRAVTWSAMEYGDGTFKNGTNTWDFFGESDQRTRFLPGLDLTGFKSWIGTLTARGGGDNPENPLNALMEARSTFTWPVGTTRYFIVLTDIGAHEHSDGMGDAAGGGPAIFADYNGVDVLNAFRGWGVVNCVSPDYTSFWAPSGTTAVKTAVANNNAAGTTVYVSDRGWDVRELADGGPSAYRTHHGTGGKWIEMPEGGNVDLTTLGISAEIKTAYTVFFTTPAGKKHGTVTVKVTVGGTTYDVMVGDMVF
jgi:hypothetical protein